MIHIVFNIDNNYIEQCKVVIKSILANTTSEIMFHIIGAEIKGKNIKSIPPPDISIITRETNFAHITTAACYRLFMPDIVDLEKVIYLDSDIIVLDDIKKIWELDVDVIAGVQDPLYIRHAKKNNLHHCYINSGVLIMNLDAMRNMDYKKRIIDAQNPKYNLSLLDQDIINIAYGEYIQHLEEKWNVYSKIYSQTTPEMIKARKKPSIIHWCGCEKPWIVPSIWNGSIWYNYKVQSK